MAYVLNRRSPAKWPLLDTNFNNFARAKASQFASRIKKYAKDCDYGTDAKNHVQDEILQKCKSDYLLEEGQN